MSSIIYQPHIDAQIKKNNLLNAGSRERFKRLPHNEKNCKKTFASLSEFEQKQLLKNLKMEYSLILFDYFSDQDSINDKIDRFATEAFNVDLPMGKIVEIHLDLINSLEHQLAFKGLHTEHISDFRITLIDVIAHLGEMYRNGTD